MPPFLALLLVPALFLLYLFFDHQIPSAATTTQFLLDATGASFDPQCAAYPDTGAIVVSIKTSAATVSRQQLDRVADVFSCLSPQNRLLFSDHDQTIGPYTLHDAISLSDPALLSSHPDFALYREQQRQSSLGLDLRDLSVLSSTDTLDQRDDKARALDKYMYPHMAHEAWRLAPDRAWYVFAPATAYYSWPNLARKLASLDPDTPLLLGRALTDAADDSSDPELSSAPLTIPDGRVGFILSRAALRALATATDPSSPRARPRRAPPAASGPHALAAAARALGINVTDAAPQFLADAPSSIPFLPSAPSRCSPVLALPDVDDALASALLALDRSLVPRAHPRDFAAQQQQQQEQGLTLAHLFTLQRARDAASTIALIDSVPFALRPAWDGLAGTPDSEAYLDWRAHAAQVSWDANVDAAACARACDAVPRCVAFSHMAFDSRLVGAGGDVLRAGGVCALSEAWRFGVERGTGVWEDDGGDVRNGPAAARNEQRWSAGWHTKRWDALAAVQEAC